MATKVSNKYPLDDIYMDDAGGVCFTFKGYLDENSIKDVFNIITPKAYHQKTELKYLEDSTPSTKATHVFFFDGINYKNLVW